MSKITTTIKVSGSLLALILLATSCITIDSEGDDLQKLEPLSGYWKFSIGDNMDWADPDFNDSDWDEIRVPGRWEDAGYNDYNGFAWYRKDFQVTEVSGDETLILVLGRIDDVDEVYLNGKLLAGSGKFPPNNISAYNLQRKYLVPAKLLDFDGTNTLAVRVYDSYREGGIVEGPVGIYIDDNNQYLDQDLSGYWKFHPGDNKQWKKIQFNDEMWNEIAVPRDWESQGYEEYDGYAWYRKEFFVDDAIRDETLYLSLGKVDDIDYVYLNGKLMASVFDLDKDGEYSRKGREYYARRIYAIPDELLNRSGKNLLAVRVYDGQIRGGIYEGPIGLMTEDQMKLYRRRHQSNQSLGDFIIDEFFTD